MSAGKYLDSLDDQSIIELIERPRNYNLPIRQKAIDELIARNLSSTRLKKMAILANADIAIDIIKADEILTDDVTMHESHFLDPEEIKEIYTEALKKYIEEKDQFRFDVWSYAIGGF